MRRESDKFRVGGRWHYLVSVDDDELDPFERAPSPPAAQNIGVSSIMPEDHRSALEAGLTALPVDLLSMCDDPRFQRFVEEIDPVGFSEFTDSLLFARIYVWKRVIAGAGELDRPEATQALLADFNRWLRRE